MLLCQYLNYFHCSCACSYFSFYIAMFSYRVEIECHFFLKASTPRVGATKARIFVLRYTFFFKSITSGHIFDAYPRVILFYRFIGKKSHLSFLEIIAKQSWKIVHFVELNFFENIGVTEFHTRLFPKGMQVSLARDWSKASIRRNPCLFFGSATSAFSRKCVNDELRGPVHAE